jgi:hypothetical protein
VLVFEITPNEVRSSPWRRWVLVLAGIAAVSLGGLAAAGCTNTASAATPGPSCTPNAARLTVQGTGLATGTPNIITVVVTISTTDATAQAALADNNGKAAAVIAAFSAGGVTKPHVQTTDLTLQPNYSFVNGAEELTGYGVNDMVTATFTDLAEAGNTIDAVSGAAGNAGQINSVSFSINDPRAVQDEARTDAVHQAVSHARAMAASAGERLGPVCSLTDSTPAPPVVPTYNSTAQVQMAGASTVPLEAGSQQANAQVTMVYGLEAGSASS